MPHHLFRSIAGDSGYTSAVSKTRLSTTSNAALRALWTLPGKTGPE
jgi:hypothetical protein